MAKTIKSKKKSKKPQTDTSLLSAIQSVARNSRTQLAGHLAKSGLYAGQEAIVEIIAAKGEIPSGEIAQQLGVRAPTITKSLTRLEEQGFIARAQHQTDKRIVTVSLTDKGKIALKKARKATRKAEKQILKGMSEKQIKQACRAMEKMRSNMEAKQGKPIK